MQHRVISALVMASYLVLGPFACVQEETAASSRAVDIDIGNLDPNDVTIIHGFEDRRNYDGTRLEGIEVFTFTIRPNQPDSTIHIGNVGQDTMLGYVDSLITTGLLDTGGYDIADQRTSEFLIIQIGAEEWSFVAPVGRHEQATAEAIDALILMLDCRKGDLTCDDSQTCALGMCIPQ